MSPISAANRTQRQQRERTKTTDSSALANTSAGPTTSRIMHPIRTAAHSPSHSSARWERAGRSSPGGSPASFEGEPARRQTSSAASASVIPLRRRRLSICPSGYMNHGSRKGITPTNATTTDITVQKRKNFPRAVSSQPAASKMSPHPPKAKNPPKPGWMSAAVLRPKLKVPRIMERHMPP